MSTIQDKPETNISSEAYDLLDCFVNGLDKLVYEIAAEIARARITGGSNAGPVKIAAEDVVEAGKRVIDAVKEQIKRAGGPSDLAAAISDAERCFAWRQQKAQR
jgi:hypothetical protein